MPPEKSELLYTPEAVAFFCRGPLGAAPLGGGRRGNPKKLYQ